MANEARQQQPSWTERLFTPAVWTASIMAGLVAMFGSPREPGEHSDVAYEESDIRVNTILLGMGGFLLSLVIIGGMLCLAYLWYSSYYSTAVAKDNASARQTLPPEPRLQESPASDLSDMRVSNDAALNKYTWIDKQKGIVGIPIERAMELIAQRGVPAQKPSTNNYFEPHAGSPETGFDRALKESER